MDDKKNQLIAEQVERWDLYARLTPTIFLLSSIILILFDIIDFETAFYVGLVGFAITAVVWWWWAIFTIKYLITTLNRASKNLQEVNQEVKSITQEVKSIRDES
tara:strand:+ start:2934 stop:3245 length:312 start_codon:yes stop_codon:yes gene_type:complete